MPPRETPSIGEMAEGMLAELAFELGFEPVDFGLEVLQSGFLLDKVFGADQGAVIASQIDLGAIIARIKCANEIGIAGGFIVRHDSRIEGIAEERFGSADDLVFNDRVTLAI